MPPPSAPATHPPRRRALLVAALALYSALIAACGDGGWRSAEEFRDLAPTRLPRAEFFVEPAAAESLAGAFVFATLRDHAFPRDRARWGRLADFRPVCLEPADLDPRFRFEGHLPGWTHQPSQIDLRFANGFQARFCFSGVVFSPQRLPDLSCTEHAPPAFLDSPAPSPPSTTGTPCATP